MGALCGPSFGLAPEPIHQVTPRGETLLELRLEKKECVWLVAAQAASRPLELRWLAGDEQLATCELRKVGWCPPTGPLCVEEDATVQLLVSDSPEPVRLLLQSWRRGARGR